jgi:hypothetical protein
VLFNDGCSHLGAEKAVGLTGKIAGDDRHFFGMFHFSRTSAIFFIPPQSSESNFFPDGLTGILSPAETSSVSSNALRALRVLRVENKGLQRGYISPRRARRHMIGCCRYIGLMVN